MDRPNAGRPSLGEYVKVEGALCAALDALPAELRGVYTPLTELPERMAKLKAKASPGVEVTEVDVERTGG